jgi:hypothetical protein
MFGCHNCPHDLSKFSSYEESPCASCSTAKDPEPFSHFADDPATFDVLQEDHPAYAEDVDRVDDVLRSLGKCVFKLVELKEKRPETWKFVEMKLADPSASYSALAARGKCRKQNVYYHLRLATKLFPELASALIVDMRFQPGRKSAVYRRMPSEKSSKELASC